MIIPANIASVNMTALHITVEPALPQDFENPDNLDFTWNIEEFQQYKMYLKLNFEEPLQISKHMPRDKLKIEIINPQLFLAQESFLRIRNESVSEKGIPS